MRGFVGRLGVGYAYTFPNLNFNLAGLLTYNVGSQKLKENVTQFSGDAVASTNLNLSVTGPNADSGGWTTKLKNPIELRAQPGYYVVPLRTLIYGTVGYARAKLETSGQNLKVEQDGNGVRGPTVDPVGTGSTNLNGLVLGLGVKYSPIAKFYVGFDYSHTSYKRKTISGQTLGDARALGNGTFPVSWEGNSGKIKTDTYLLTVGYYFF